MSKSTRPVCIHDEAFDGELEDDNCARISWQNYEIALLCMH